MSALGTARSIISVLETLAGVSTTSLSNLKDSEAQDRTCLGYGTGGRHSPARVFQGCCAHFVSARARPASARTSIIGYNYQFCNELASDCSNGARAVAASLGASSAPMRPHQVPMPSPTTKAAATTACANPPSSDDSALLSSGFTEELGPMG